MHVTERPGQVDRHHRLDRQDGARSPAGGRGRASRTGSSGRSPGTARTRPGGGASSGAPTASPRPRRRAGAARPARGRPPTRDVHVIAVDRDPLAVGFALADERAVISSEDEPGVERLARAREVDGIVSPGCRLAGRDRRAVAERLGLPHPIDARDRGRSRRRRRASASGSPRPACRSRGCFSPGDPAVTSPASSRRPTGRASAG